MLRLRLCRDAPSPSEPKMKAETDFRDGSVPSGSPPFFIRLVVSGDVPVERDV